MELKENFERNRRRKLAKLPYRQKLLAVRSLLEIKQKMRRARLTLQPPAAKSGRR